MAASDAGEAPELLLIFTVDTECSVLRQPDPNPERVVDELIFGDFGKGTAGGIGLQMDLLERHGFRGCFFVDILMEHLHGREALERTLEAILSRGHEVQLHLHTDYLAWSSDSDLAALAPALVTPEQDVFRRAMELAVDLFERRVGRPPLAYRAGGFRIADMHFPVLEELGIRIDSSVQFSDRSRVEEWMHSRTQPFRVGDVLEVPPTRLLVGSDTGGWKPRDFTPETATGDAVSSVPADSGAPPLVATLVSHSFQLLRACRTADPVEVEAFERRMRSAVEPPVADALLRRLRRRMRGTLLTYGDEPDEQLVAGVDGLLRRIAERPGARCATYAELLPAIERALPGDPRDGFDPVPALDSRTGAASVAWSPKLHPPSSPRFEEVAARPPEGDGGEGGEAVPPLVPVPPVELTGYPHRLSGKAGERIVFCLDGPIATGARLPVESVSGETVGRLSVGPDWTEREVSPAPWAEGLGLPARAALRLDPSLPSGLYAAGGKVPFVHRGAGAASVAVLIPSNTANAFNPAGGRSLYETPEGPPADVLSFDRPLEPWRLAHRCWPFVRWFAAANPDPLNTTYLVDADLEAPDALDGVEVLVVIGRSEYWTRTMRERFDAFVDRGGRALLLCSEIMYWQARLDTAGRRLLRYRGSDPHPDPLMRTTVWHDPSLEYPVYPRTGCDFAHGGFDAAGDGIGWSGARIVCPDSPLLDGSGLAAGDVLSLPDASVWDGAPAVLDADGTPRAVDFGDSPPWRHEVIGYNPVKPAAGDSPDGEPAAGLWLALRHAPESGTVVHCGTLGWCGERAVGGRGPDSERTRRIVLRMLEILRDDAWPFSFPPNSG